MIVMELKTKVIIGSGLAVGTGATIYVVKKKRDAKNPENPDFVVDDFVFDLKEDAEIVLEQLKESAEKYGHVTVADFHDLIGEGSSYILNGYGWYAKAMNKAKIKKSRHGYTIKFPKVEIIK